MKNFKFFSSNKQEVIQEETQVQVISPNKMVQQVHDEFETSSTKLLKEAQDIINGLNIQNEEKVKRLSWLGFKNSNEVVQGEKKINEKRVKEELISSINSLYIQFPLLKFITHAQVLTICEKYNLVMGDNSQYQGFIPEKNLKEIEDFIKDYPNLCIKYYETYSGWTGMSSRRELSKEMYEIYNTDREYRMSLLSSSYYEKVEKPELKICAPEKDMKKEGYKLNSRIFTKEVPDPVVLLPYKFQDIQFYIIITKWGEESSDPILVNENHN